MQNISQNNVDLDTTKNPNEIVDNMANDVKLDSVVKVSRVNKKKIILVSLLLIVVWLVIISVFTIWSPKNSNDIENDQFQPIQIKPTIAFTTYSDDYLEFEHPADSVVNLVGGINYHPSVEGRTINGVQYMSINKSDDVKLEFIYLLQGGMFPYVSIDTKSLILSRDTFNDANLEYGLVETQLTNAPEIEKVPDYSLYLVYVQEMSQVYLMSMDEQGIYESVNYGAWVDLDFMGKFSENTEWGNFVGLRCKAESDSDYEYCKQMVLTFFDTVEKKFVENEKYEKPKLEAILELRNPSTAELIDKYRFYIEDYPQGSYVNSSWNSLSVLGSNASLQLIFFEPTVSYSDISFSDQRASQPTPDIQATEVFSNLIRGEERVVSGNQVKKSFSYRMYYPDPDKNVCYKDIPSDMKVENYAGCTSYKLKIKAIDAQIQATCTFNPDLSNASATCDELIKSLKVEKVQ